MQGRLMRATALAAAMTLVLGLAAAPGHADPARVGTERDGAADQDVLLTVGTWRGALGTVTCGHDPQGITVLYFCDHRGDSEEPGTGELPHSACREAFAATGPIAGLELGCEADLGFEFGRPASSSGPGDPGDPTDPNDPRGRFCTTSTSLPGVMRYRSAALDQVFDITVEVPGFSGTEEGGVATLKGEGSSTGTPEFRADFEGTIEITEDFPCRQPEKKGLFEGTIRIFSPSPPHNSLPRVATWGNADGRVSCEPQTTWPGLEFRCEYRGNADDPGTTGDHMACREFVLATGESHSCSAEFGFSADSRVAILVTDETPVGCQGGEAFNSPFGQGILMYSSPTLESDIGPVMGVSHEWKAVPSGPPTRQVSETVLEARDRFTVGGQEYRVQVDAAILVDEPFDPAADPGPCEAPERFGEFSGMIRINPV